MTRSKMLLIAGIGMLPLGACGSSVNPFSYAPFSFMRQGEGACFQPNPKLEGAFQVSCNPETLAQEGIDPNTVQRMPVNVPRVQSKYDSAGAPNPNGASSYLAGLMVPSNATLPPDPPVRTAQQMDDEVKAHCDGAATFRSWEAQRLQSGTLDSYAQLFPPADPPACWPHDKTGRLLSVNQARDFADNHYLAQVTKKQQRAMAVELAHPHWDRLNSDEQEQLVYQAEAFFVHYPDALTPFGYDLAGTDPVDPTILYNAIQIQTGGLNSMIHMFRNDQNSLDHLPLIIKMRNRVAAARAVWCMQQPKKCPTAWKVEEE